MSLPSSGTPTHPVSSPEVREDHGVRVGRRFRGGVRERRSESRRRASKKAEPKSSTSTTGPTTSPTTRSRASPRPPASRSPTTTTPRTTTCSPSCGREAPAMTSSFPPTTTLVKMKHGKARRGARPLADPEREEPRPALPHRGVRPREQVLDPVAVGHDGNRLRQDEGRRRGHRLGRVQPPVGPKRGRRSSTKRATPSRWRCSR